MQQNSDLVEMGVEEKFSEDKPKVATKKTVTPKATSTEE